MFDDGEAPLSELNADSLKQLFAAAGILDNADGVIAKLMDMLDIARDSQTTLAAREMENSIDWQQVDAEASRAYDESD
jgi:lipopolysaccharide biosynthesis regulator YciM